MAKILFKFRDRFLKIILSQIEIANSPSLPNEGNKFFNNVGCVPSVFFFQLDILGNRAFLQFLKYSLTIIKCPFLWIYIILLFTLIFLIAIKNPKSVCNDTNYY